MEFTTVSYLLAYLGLDTRATAFVKKYMNPTKLYKKRYEFYYSENFTGVITNKGPRRFLLKKNGADAQADAETKAK